MYAVVILDAFYSDILSSNHAQSQKFFLFN